MTNYPIGPYVNGCAAQKTPYAYVTSLTNTIHWNEMLQYDTRCYFNVQSKADMSRLNLPHGTNNWKNKRLLQWSRPDNKLRPTNTVLFSNSRDRQQPQGEDVHYLPTSKISHYWRSDVVRLGWMGLLVIPTTAVTSTLPCVFSFKQLIIGLVLVWAHLLIR